MKKYLLSSLLIFVMAVVTAIGVYAQNPSTIYLVKGNKVIAAYGTSDVEYLTFELDETITSGEFKIDIDEIDKRYVVWTVTPTNPNMYYYTSIYTPASLKDRFNDSVDEMARTLANDMRFLAQLVGEDLETFMKTAVLSKGTTQHGDDQISADTEYAIVVFGCDPDGSATTDTYTSCLFRTLQQEMTGLTVEFTIQVAGNDVTITTNPSDSAIPYYVAVAPKADGFDPQGTINNLIWKGAVMGKDVDEVIEEITVTGQHSQTFSLEPNTEYEVYAFSISDEGVVNSLTSSQTFVTEDVLASQNTFQITVNEVTANEVNFTITTSNDDYYTIGVLPKSTLAGMSDNEIINYYLTNFAFPAEYYQTHGTRTTSWDGLQESTDYILFAFGYYMDEVTTGLTKTEFSTPEGIHNDPSEFEAAFRGLTITGNNGDVMIYPNFPDIPYLWNFVETENATEEYVKTFYKGEWDRYQEMGLNYVEMRRVKGDQNVKLYQMEEGKTYKLFAVPASETDGSFLAPISWSRTFSMEAGGWID